MVAQGSGTGSGVVADTHATRAEAMLPRAGTGVPRAGRSEGGRGGASGCGPCAVHRVAESAKAGPAYVPSEEEAPNGAFTSEGTAIALVPTSAAAAAGALTGAFTSGGTAIALVPPSAAASGPGGHAGEPPGGATADEAEEAEPGTAGSTRPVSPPLWPKATASASTRAASAACCSARWSLCRSFFARRRTCSAVGKVAGAAESAIARRSQCNEIQRECRAVQGATDQTC